MSEDQIPLFPVAELTISTVKALDAVIVRPDFLSHSMQDVHSPTPGRSYVLTIPQARYLAERMLAAVQTLESDATPAGAHPRH